MLGTIAPEKRLIDAVKEWHSFHNCNGDIVNLANEKLDKAYDEYISEKAKEQKVYLIQC